MAFRIHVGNLSSTTADSSLCSLFEAYGRGVERVTIALDPQTGDRPGLALVQMTSERDAQAAVEALNGREVDGNELVVRLARDTPARPAARLFSIRW